MRERCSEPPEARLSAEPMPAAQIGSRSGLIVYGRPGRGRPVCCSDRGLSCDKLRVIAHCDLAGVLHHLPMAHRWCHQ